MSGFMIQGKPYQHADLHRVTLVDVLDFQRGIRQATGERHSWNEVLAIALRQNAAGRSKDPDKIVEALMDPDTVLVLVAMVFAAKRLNGERVSVADVIALDLGDIVPMPDDDDDEDEGAENPTPPRPASGRGASGARKGSRSKRTSKKASTRA